MLVRIMRLNEKFNDIPLPKYITPGSAGLDVCAAINEPITIEPLSTALIPTNLAIELEPGYECQVRTRSGLALNYGIFALNAPGTIDSDYRGEIKIILSNFSKMPYTINRGDRVAQLVFAKYEQASLVEVKKIEDTQRGADGFGSSGI
ncbi:MAG TPA: dUTP diphosphatase [Candidatus Kapabacteria bacterium]|jgi:dUTP pyrophosphatase|nr:dUTP diphosphatase [Candidatus Kapabacteria bacterium]HOV92121.1 dUTP diphosphatase [Candidatus Kapabacteria bacterium]